MCERPPSPRTVIADHPVGEREETGVDLIGEGREHEASGDDNRQLALRVAAGAELHAVRKIQSDQQVELALGVCLAHERLLQAGGDIPVDAAHVIAVAIRAVFVEIEAVPPLAASEGAAAQIPDLSGRVDLQVAQLGHQVIG